MASCNVKGDAPSDKCGTPVFEFTDLVRTLPSLYSLTLSLAQSPIEKRGKKVL